MIVADTNLIAYLLLPGDHAAAAKEVLRRDASWAAPLLWRSELQNVLALYLRKALLELSGATAVMSRAERLMAGDEYALPAADVLRLARETSLSAYDCEFIALARRLGVPLVTSDQQLLRAVPETATSPAHFLAA